MSNKTGKQIEEALKEFKDTVGDMPRPPEISPQEYRKKVVIEVVGPVSKGGMKCRKSLGYCGEEWPDVYHIVGIGVKGPKYWVCPRCGCNEVVTGTPMNFGEVMRLDKLIMDKI